MPQTVEEHLEDLEDSDTDSCSTHSADSQPEPEPDTGECITEVTLQTHARASLCDIRIWYFILHFLFPSDTF